MSKQLEQISQIRIQTQRPMALSLVVILLSLFFFAIVALYIGVLIDKFSIKDLLWALFFFFLASLAFGSGIFFGFVRKPAHYLICVDQSYLSISDLNYPDDEDMTKSYQIDLLQKAIHDEHVKWGGFSKFVREIRFRINDKEIIFLDAHAPEGYISHSDLMRVWEFLRRHLPQVFS